MVLLLTIGRRDARSVRCGRQTIAGADRWMDIDVPGLCGYCTKYMFGNVPKQTVWLVTVDWRKRYYFRRLGTLHSPHEASSCLRNGDSFVTHFLNAYRIIQRVGLGMVGGLTKKDKHQAS